ncbi:MAG: ATP-binding cassette domain-containing protein, partial [Cyclobacteriaceae bacterium]
MITVSNIKKSFGRLQVLDDISFKVDKGGIIAILGPNGSGKTTFLKILLGMVIADGGKILYQKKDISKSHEYRKHIGYLPQIARFPDNLKVREVIHMIADVRNEPSNA